MGTLHVPEHTGLLGALADHGFAPGFDDAGSDEEAGAPELRVRHAGAIVEEVLKSPEDFLFLGWAGAGPTFGGGDEPIDFPRLEPMAPLPGVPGFGRFVWIGDGGRANASKIPYF